MAMRMFPSPLVEVDDDELDAEVDFGLCEECNQPRTGTGWCKECNAKRFQQNFKNWTSGNNDIDRFIQDTQLSAECREKVLEWVPYNRFHSIEYIAEGGFGKVYKAIWIDGFIDNWDSKNKNWFRYYPNGLYILKSLNNSKNVTSEFINEVKMHHKLDYDPIIINFYGISQDLETKNYMMVLSYAEGGTLQDYLDKNGDSYSWSEKIHDLCDIAYGLNYIHKNNLIHRDFHFGNILKSGYNHTFITDLGLCKQADGNNKSIYGVLPYVAPEVLKGQIYTQASDIYSFGIIMYEVISGKPPYHNISHNQGLAMRICHGLRPRFNIKVPQLIVNLIKKCLDANPLNRPISKELYQILLRWRNELRNNKQTELQKQVEKVDEINKNLQNNISSFSIELSYKTHDEAIYTSRLLNFNNLPEPKNSDDYYYEQNDNLISTKFSEFDIPQLEIDDIDDNDDAEEKE